jgi:hypothetical protein
VPPFEGATKRRIGLSVGQLMFTPDVISQRALIKEDRPYAGWLYGAVSLHAQDKKRHDGLELALGMVGPASLAEDTQESWHDLIKTTDPNGWDNQLSNEFGIALTYERQWRFRLMSEQKEFYGLGMDLIPNAGATLGNIWTLASAGATLRFGQYMPEDFGPPRIRPSLPGSDAIDPINTWGWYLFAGAEARYVLRNIFLDGNTFSASHSVKKNRWVGDFQGGLALILGSVRLTYTQVFRTREFIGQTEPDHFGTVSISWRF